MLKAPKGGLTSRVNGQRYEGGEFMPEHGLFCGKKGAARKTKWEKAATLGRTVDLGGAKMFEVYERDLKASHVSYVCGMVICDTERQAREAFGGACNLWAQQI